MNWKALAFNQKLALVATVCGILAVASQQMTDIITPWVSSVIVATAIVKSITSLFGLISAVCTGLLTKFTSTDSVVRDVVQQAKAPDSPIQAIITTANPEGKALAASIPGPIVAAGSAAATDLAKP